MPFFSILDVFISLAMADLVCRAVIESYNYVGHINSLWCFVVQSFLFFLVSKRFKSWWLLSIQGPPLYDCAACPDRAGLGAGESNTAIAKRISPMEDVLWQPAQALMGSRTGRLAQ